MRNRLIQSIIVVFLLLSLLGGAFAQRAIEDSFMYGENLTSVEPKEKMMPNGVLYKRYITYGTQYPNSYLDIAYSANPMDYPTIVLVHGGGYIGFSNNLYEFGAWGKKLDASVTDFLEAGFNIVSIEYAYAPEYKYPTPLFQVQQAIEYIYINQDELGIDASNIVLMGSSAGGQLVAQYAAALTNDSYAKEIGMEFSGNEPAINSVILQCGLIDPTRFSKTGSLKVNVTFTTLANYYFENKSQRQQANIIDAVDCNYPPTFMDDGMEGSFAAQAMDLANRLDELGILNELHLYEGKKHAFDYEPTDLATKNRKDIIAFILKADGQE